MNKLIQRLFLQSQKLSKLILIFTVVLIGLSIDSLKHINFSLDMTKNIQISNQKNIELTKAFEKEDYYLHILIKKKNKEQLTYSDLCFIKRALISPQFYNNNIEYNTVFDLISYIEKDSRLLTVSSIESDCRKNENSKDKIEINGNNGFIDSYLGKERNSFLINSQYPVSQSSSLTQENIEEIISWANKNLSQYDVHFYGKAILNYYIAKILKADFLNNIILLSLIFVLFKIFFGTFRGGVLLITCLSLSYLFLLYSIALTGISLNPLSASLFVLLSIASLEDYIYLSFLRRKYDHWRESFNALLVPSLLTSLTTIIGFGSLYISKIITIKQFSLLAIFGALIEWIVMFIILPALIKEVRFFQNWSKEEKVKLNFAANWIPNKLFISSFIILFFISIFCIFNLQTNESVLDLFPKNHQIHSAHKEFTSHRNWNLSLNIALDGNSSHEKNQRLLKDLTNIPHFGLVESYDYYLNSITKDLSNVSKSIATNELGNSPLKAHFFKDKIERIVANIKTYEYIGLKESILKIKTLCKEYNCNPFGFYVSYLDYADELLNTLYYSFALSLGLIIFSIAIISFLKTKSLNLKIIFSAIWGPIVIGSVLYIFNIDLNFITCIIISVLIGLSGDNAIQFIFFSNKNLNNDHLKDIGKASILVTIFTASGSLVYALSGFKFVQILGVIFCIGFSIGLIGDLYLLKGLIKKNSD